MKYYWQLRFLTVICYATIGGQTPGKFCVSESNSNDGLCHQHNSVESHTLAYYMNNSQHYFNSYDTYVFQHGQHTPLDQLILHIRNVTNLSLIGPGKAEGSKPAVINCNGKSAGFVFYLSSNILIENITFYACVRKDNTKTSGSPVISFYKGANVSLLGVTLSMSVDEAFIIENVDGEVLLNNMQVLNSNTGGRKVHSAGNFIEYRHCHNVQTIVFITNSRFVNNSNYADPHNTYAAGLTISINCPGITVKMYNVTMLSNTGYSGGNLALRFLCYLGCFNVSAEIGHCQFEGGNSTDGGGMFAKLTELAASQASVTPCSTTPKEHLLLHVYDTNFTNNVARYTGGGIRLVQTPSTCPYCIENIVFSNVTFNNNSVIITGHGGIAIHSQTNIKDYLHLIPHFHIILVNCSIFNNNKPQTRDGSGTAAVFLKSNKFFLLENTAVFCNEVTGIMASDSNIILSHNITIVNNTGSSGGGIFLCQKAIMYLETHTNVTIAHNSAKHTGGGIYVETSCLVSKPPCFFQLCNDLQALPTKLVSLYNNHAYFAGNNIFGGSIDTCFISKKPHNHHNAIDIYKAVFSVPSNTVNPTSVSSPPRHICLCTNKRPVCSFLNNQVPQIQLTIEKFPGETFTIEAVLVGQFNGTVPGTVQAWLKFAKNITLLGPNENIQKIETRNCTKLNYTIYSHQNHEVLQLGAQVPGDVSGLEELNQFQKYSINITLKECPFGFLRTNDMSFCDCNQLFHRHNSHISCDIKSQTIKRVSPVWIGFVDSAHSRVAAYHSHCPLDYCISKDVYLHALENFLSQDKQCIFNRTGVLCGSCSEGFSSVLGSSQCQYCSNYWSLLLIPFALLGILLVIGLTLFNITVAEGTLSGIIFYCNIVGANASTFLQGQGIPYLTTFLKTFVLLINLETGIPLCLFDGLDAYIKAWLNFSFPLYIWLITGLFICLGGHCSWIVKHNAVKVLATLILLSYARLLSAISEALQISYVYLENGYSEQRWLIDGNIKYFQGKHIPLATFAIVFSALLLPFAFCLCFIQCLQKGSHYSVLSWVNHLKPFFDAYTGPFTSRGRFWTGLLLLSRGILFVVSALNTKGDSEIIFGTSALIVILLLLVAWIVPGGLYRQQCLNALESFSLVNLGMLASLLFIFNNESVYSALISHICVSTILFAFVGVISYHILSLRPVKTIFHHICCFRQLMHYCGMVWRNKVARINDDDDVPIINYRNPYAEDREPLLNTN